MKLVLIHQNIESELLLINSFKSDCIIKTQSEYNNFEELLNNITDLRDITHLTFVYKFNGDLNIPFLDTTELSNYQYFNKNIISLISNLKLNNSELIIDILTCNLNSDSFTESVNKLETDLSLNIRYSVDQTGNNPDGNWILESDNVDIKDLYFEDSILDWKGKLDSNFYGPAGIKLIWVTPSMDSSGVTLNNNYLSAKNVTYIVDSSSSTTSKIIAGLAANTTYYFKISAVNINGEGNLSPALTQATSNIVPNPPTDLSASSITASSLMLSWTDPSANGGSAITYYNIYKSTDNITFSLDSSSNTTSKAVTGLSTNTIYYFKVVAVNSQGESALSTGITITTLPGQVGTVNITPGNTLIDLSWTPISGSATITGYLVERSTDSSSWITDVSSNINTYYTSSSLTNGTLYYYRVSAINNFGIGAPSDVVSATPSEVPFAPTTPLASSITATGLTLSWTAPITGGSPIISYNIYKSTDNITYTVDSSSNTTTKAITGLSINTTYYFKISAVNINGEGSFSPELSQATSPGNPTSLFVNTITPTSLILNWSPPSNLGTSIIYYYKIYKSTDNSTFIVDSSSTNVYKTITSLNSNTNYYFKVSTFTNTGEGALSSVITTATLPGQIGTVTATKGNAVVDLSWNAISGTATVSGYLVERSTDSSSWVTDVSSNANRYYTSTGLTNGTLYYFRVSARNASGTGSASATVSTTPSTVPSAPTAAPTASSVTSTSMTLSWIAPTNGGSDISSYKIYRSTDSSSFVFDSSSNSTSKAITGLSVNTTYYFKISAVNANGEGTQSAALTQATLNIVPNVPTSLAASSYTASGLTLSWTAPTANGGSAVTSYNIYKSTDSSSFVFDSSSNTTSKAITGLSANTTYYFKVSAVNSLNEGAQSTALTTATLPGQISSVTATKGNAVVDLSWNAISGNATVSGYLVERSTDSSSWITDVSSNANRYYTSTGLTNGTLYYYRVSARNASGTGVASATISATPSTIPSAPAAAPTASSITSTSITLSWIAPTNGGSDISSYKIYKSTDSSSFVFDSLSNTTSKAITGLSVNTIYYFKVSAVNANGEGTQSATLTQATLNIVPNAPTSLAASSYTASGLTLSWTAPTANGGSAVTSYNIYKSTDLSSFVFDSSSNTTSKGITGLSANTTYYFKVTAVNSLNEGAQSTALTTNTLPGQIDSVTAIKGNTVVDLSWNAISGNGTVSGYLVERSTDSSSWITDISSNPNRYYTSTGLTNGTLYYFRVSARNASGTGAASATISATPSTLPSQITTILAIPGNTFIDLSWNAPENGGNTIVNYLIEKSFNNLNWTTDASANTNTFYRSNDLNNGTLYYYRISARNINGTGTPSDSVSEIPFTVADQISFISIIAGNTIIDLSWNAPFNGGRDISNYLIEKSEDNSTWITESSSNITYYRATGLTNDVLYYFRVSAINLAGTNTPSPSVSEIPYDNPYQINPISIVAGNTIIDLSWNAPFDGGRDISDYLIEKSLDNSTWIADGSSNTTYYTVTGLNNGTLYYFRVYARNLDGLSPASYSISETPYTMPSPIENLNYTKYASQVDLTWDIPLENGGADISSYTLSYYPTGGLPTIISNITDTSINVLGLEPNTEYSFEIVAINRAGSSSTELILLTTYSITAPINFSGDASNNSVYLSWNQPSDTGGLDISGYVISINESGYSDISLNANILNYNYTGLINSTSYTFTIYAYNAAGIGQNTLITCKTSEYTPTTELPPGQDYYVVIIDGSETTFENKLTVTDFSQNEIGISQDPTLFNNPTLFISSVFDISSINNLIATTITGYTKNISSILLKRNVLDQEVISQGQIGSVLDGNIVTKDLSNNSIELRRNQSDLSDNIITVTSVIESTQVEIENKLFMKFYIKLIDLSSQEIITNNFNLPITFNLTNSNVNSDSLLIKRLNELNGEYENVGTTDFISHRVFSYNFNSNSQYILQQVIPDPPTDLSAYQIGSGSNSKVYVTFSPPTFTGLSPIISYTLEASAIGETTKSITKTDLSNSILVPFLTIGKEWTFKIKATSSIGTSIWSIADTLIPTGSGTTTGDPIITTIYGEKYLLPNVNGRFLIFDNKKIDYPLYITADCFFLTPKELMNSVFISKWATDYTFMKTLTVKFKNYEFSIDMNTLNIIHKFKKNNEITIGDIYEDKMILSRHYSANRKKELGNNLKFNGKSRKIDLIHEDKVYTLRVSVDLGCADHRNEFVLDGPDMKSGYGAIISKKHKTKIMDLKL